MYQEQVIAVFGVSQNPAKYGYKIFSTLKGLGMQVFGIHPKGGLADGQPLFTRLAELPQRAQVAIMVIPPAGLDSAVKQCIENGVEEIWFQPGARDEQALNAARAAGVRAVNGCFMTENGFW